MRPQARERMLGEQHELDLRYGVADHEYDEFERELELADRIAEYASAPPFDAGCRTLARRRLGPPGSPNGGGDASGGTYDEPGAAGVLAPRA